MNIILSFDLFISIIQQTEEAVTLIMQGKNYVFYCRHERGTLNRAWQQAMP